MDSYKKESNIESSFAVGFWNICTFLYIFMMNLYCGTTMWQEYKTRDVKFPELYSEAVGSTTLDHGTSFTS